MSDWDDYFRNEKNKKKFCGSLTGDIQDETLKNEKFGQCIIDPLGFVERNYEDELCTFGRSAHPKIRDLLECEKTENIINLMAKKKEGRKSSYKINKEEALKSALEDLGKFKGQGIEPFVTKEKKIIKEKSEKESCNLVESCLPTESYLIERLKLVAPKSEPSAGKGNFIMRFLRSLASSQNPHKTTQNEIRPSTVAVSHTYKHKKKKYNHEEHLEEDWEKEFFDKLKREDIIKKGK